VTWTSTARQAKNRSPGTAPGWLDLGSPRGSGTA
jgi:hypothetical protein